MTTEQPTLAARLAKIMGEVGPIEKKGKITSQGSGPTYKFTRDSDVLAAAAPRMAREGIVLVPEHVHLLSMDPSMSGKQFIANIRTEWHVTDGKESIRFETFGQGADSGDKALPKAQSNARKYAFFMLYHIVTGDDPDHWASHDEQPERVRGGSPSSPNAPAPASYRRAELAALMVEHNLDNDAVLRVADRIGIPINERPMSDESMDRLIEAIETPQSEDSPARAGSDAATAPGSEDGGSPPATSSGSGPAPTLDDVLAASGGELIPPKPGTDPYPRPACPGEGSGAGVLAEGRGDGMTERKPKWMCGCGAVSASVECCESCGATRGLVRVVEEDEIDTVLLSAPPPRHRGGSEQRP